MDLAAVLLLKRFVTFLHCDSEKNVTLLGRQRAIARRSGLMFYCSLGCAFWPTQNQLFRKTIFRPLGGAAASFLRATAGTDC